MNCNSRARDAASQRKRIHADNHLPSSNERSISNFNSTGASKAPEKRKDTNEISGNGKFTEYSKRRKLVRSMDSVRDHRRLEIFAGSDKPCPKQKSSIPAAPVNDLCGGALHDLEQQEKKNQDADDDDDIPATAIAKQVHNLEIVAYRCVLNALRARGPLHWRHEAMLTDLRLSLHISDDEHRLELAQMRSAAGPYSVHS